MLRASRLSETHALAVQTRSAEPAGVGGWAAGPPAAGPPLQPQMHDAASATTPSAATQIRLATANLPALPAAWQSHEASRLWAAREVLVPPGVHSAVCEEWPRLRYLPKPSRRSCRMTAAPSFAEMPHIRWQTSARNRPAACHSN